MSITIRTSRRSAGTHGRDLLEPDGDVTPPLGTPITPVDPTERTTTESGPADRAYATGSTEILIAAPPPIGGARAFAWRYGIGAAAGSIMFLWVLGAGRVSPLRTALATRLFSNFYDLQARAFLDGHLVVPIGSLSI